VEWRKEAENAWQSLRGSACPTELFDQVKALRDSYRAAGGH